MTLSINTLIGILVALAGGAGTLGALLAAGIAARWLAPLIRTEIAAHEATAATVAARRAETERVIEDQVRRDDGKIRQHVQVQDAGITTELRETLAGLRRDVTDSSERLSRIEGLLEARYGERSTQPPGPSRHPTPLNTPLPPTRPIGGR